MVSFIGSGAASRTNGANRLPVPGTGVTIAESLLVSTRQRSLATPVPARSLTATPAPTEEIHAWIFAYSGFTWRMVRSGRPGGSAIGSSVKWNRDASELRSDAE